MKKFVLIVLPLVIAALALVAPSQGQEQLQHPEVAQAGYADPGCCCEPSCGCEPDGCCEPSCGCNDGCGCGDCCGNDCCRDCCVASVEKVKVEKHCWCVEKKKICVPKIVCPWSKGGSGLTLFSCFKKDKRCCGDTCGCGDECGCCDTCGDGCCNNDCCGNGCGCMKPRCGKVKCVRDITKKKYECEKCVCKWEVRRLPPCCDCCDGCGCADSCGCGGDYTDVPAEGPTPASADVPVPAPAAE